MRILFLAGALGWGGAERQLLLLAGDLSANGHETAVAAFSSDSPAYDCGSLAVHSLRKRGIAGWPAAWLRLERLVRGARPDVLYSFLTTPNIMALLMKPAARGMRIVWGVRNSGMRPERYRLRDRIAWRLEAGLRRFPDCVVVNSGAGRDWIGRGGIMPRRVEVIPNGVDIGYFRPDPEGGRAVRESLGIAPDSLVVGMVGRLDPMKGHDDFLRAGALAVRENPRIFLLCVGGVSGAAAGALMEKAGALGLKNRFAWTPFRKDMPAVYSSLDLLASCSLYGEGMPNVVAEAMACGIPVAVTDVGDSALVAGDRRCVAAPGDPGGMKGVWLRILGPAGGGSGEDLRARIAAAYSRERAAARHEAVFREIIQ